MQYSVVQYRTGTCQLQSPVSQPLVIAPTGHLRLGETVIRHILLTSSWYSHDILLASSWHPQVILLTSSGHPPDILKSSSWHHCTWGHLKTSETGEHIAHLPAITSSLWRLGIYFFKGKIKLFWGDFKGGGGNIFDETRRSRGLSFHLHY